MKTEPCYPYGILPDAVSCQIMNWFGGGSVLIHFLPPFHFRSHP